MTTTSTLTAAAARAIDKPLAGFSQCHADILSQLAAFRTLPALAAAARQARHVATATLALFEPGVLEHHADEENELFPTVLRSAAPGREQAEVASLVRQLVEEHRRIEALWIRLRPAVRLVATGKARDFAFDAVAVAELVERYTAHARLEEQEFLPLAQAVLGRDGNHMAALGVALHMRHAPSVIGYL